MSDDKDEVELDSVLGRNRGSYAMCMHCVFSSNRKMCFPHS